MRPENVIVGIEIECHADCGGFLTDRKMRGSGMVICEAFVGALGLDIVQDRFEFSNRTHVLPDMQEILRRVLGEFLFESAVVCVQLNFGKADDITPAYSFRVDNN